MSPGFAARNATSGRTAPAGGAFDVLVVGSGFGGSVCAMRLAQKGYRVAVLEAGRSFGPEDFPRANWDIRRYLWCPHLGCRGFQKITWLKGVMVLHGVGVGGGSLVYANVLMKPPRGLFRDVAWPRGFDWERELETPYEEARRMLGVSANPVIAEADRALREVATRMGASRTYHPTEVGVYFGDPNGPATDPYFSGDGPARSACNSCGGCMVGCRYGAKNTLDYNYLHFAQRWGVKIFAETRATRIAALSASAGGGYRIDTESTRGWLRAPGPAFHAPKVVLAAGVLGTVELLLRNRDVYGTLPDLSSRLGEAVRTNGESLLGVTSFDRARDFSKGIAIGAAIKPDAGTTIEAVRYPSGSGLMRLLGVPLTPAGGPLTRPLKMILRGALRLARILRLWAVRDWARHTVILLVMQAVDEKLRLTLKRPVFRWLSPKIHGEATDKPIPSYLPLAQEAARHLADAIEGEPQNVVSEVLLRTPATAHVLGGCCMGESRETGVVDAGHEVFGHPGLFVCDGSVVPVNLAINPSLTIAAMAERFCSLWPLNEGADPAVVASRKIRHTEAKP